MRREKKTRKKRSIRYKISQLRLVATQIHIYNMNQNPFPVNLIDYYSFDYKKIEEKTCLSSKPADTNGTFVENLCFIECLSLLCNREKKTIDRNLIFHLITFRQ